MTAAVAAKPALEAATAAPPPQPVPVLAPEAAALDQRYIYNDDYNIAITDSLCSSVLIPFNSRPLSYSSRPLSHSDLIRRTKERLK